LAAVLAAAMQVMLLLVGLVVGVVAGVALALPVLQLKDMPGSMVQELILVVVVVVVPAAPDTSLTGRMAAAQVAHLAVMAVLDYLTT
jgi:hypothetical protein